MPIKNSPRDLSLHEKIVRALLFLASIAIIVYFLPREGKFRYHFQEGKPWKYGLLTAPFDFPIYKNDLQLKLEYDSILQQFQPYYKMRPAVVSKSLSNLRLDYDSKSKRMPHHDYNYLDESLERVYRAGIISSEDMNSLQKDNIQYIRIIDNNISKLRSTSSLLTVRQAYENIMASAPSDESRRRLRNFNIDNYLEENLVYDSITSRKVKEELLHRVSQTGGMVQAGERIVDRGEIITEQTYNILRSFEIANQRRAGTARQQSLTLIGQIILTLMLMGSILLFLYMFRPAMYSRLRDLQVILVMITTVVMGCAFFSHFRVVSIYLMPFAIVPIVIRTFLDSRVAFFCHLITILLCSFIAPFAFEFLLIQVMAGIVTIFSLKDLTQRSQLVKTAIFVLLAYCVTYIVYTLITEGVWQKLNSKMFIYFVISAALLLFAYLLIFILEKALGFTSSVTLMELSNINSPLLRKLSEECPGTFQHSLQISNLSAQAAMRIGANVQLVRVAALYHDIGKLGNPQFFTENQIDINPHDNIQVEDSLQIIKQHVTEGINMAKRENLPDVVIDFIATHHGSGKIKYFYNKWKNSHPDEEADEDMFSYPGPNPYSKEQAILMMADCIEAASRSLKDYSDQAITDLVNNIIDGQISEGMFNDTALTFHDVELVKEVFIDRLKAMYHKRISYPELKSGRKGNS